MTVSMSIRFRVFVRDEYQCQYCGASATGSQPLEIDHIIPRSQGGTDDPGNLITACHACNQGKLDMMLSPEQIARFSNRPLPVLKKSRQPRPSKVAAIKHVIERIRRPYQEPKRPIPVSTWFVFEGPDQINPRFICSRCGFLNELEGDQCGCTRRERAPEREINWCRRCGDVEAPRDESYCQDCYDLLYCWECGDELDDDSEERYCPDCLPSVREAEEAFQKSGCVRCPSCRYEQMPVAACRVCDFPLLPIAERSN
jgi:hypothetical protein